MKEAALRCRRVTVVVAAPTPRNLAPRSSSGAARQWEAAGWPWGWRLGRSDGTTTLVDDNDPVFWVRSHWGSSVRLWRQVARGQHVDAVFTAEEDGEEMAPPSG